MSLVALSASFEFLCFGSPSMCNSFSAGIVFRHYILTSKDGPHEESDKTMLLFSHIHHNRPTTKLYLCKNNYYVVSLSLTYKVKLPAVRENDNGVNLFNLSY